MTGKLIAVANMKGGVGKTTTVVSLAETLAADDPKCKVLVVDLDPQASASVCLAGDDVLAQMIVEGNTIDAFLNDLFQAGSSMFPISTIVREGVGFVDHRGSTLSTSLLPSGPGLRHVDRSIIYSLFERKMSENALEAYLAKVLKPEFDSLRDHFDYVVFDCAPGISPIGEVAIRTSDLVIVPTIPDRISLYGLNAFCLSFWQMSSKALPQPERLPYVLVTRLIANVRQHRQMIDELKKEASLKDAGFRLFETRIPQNASLADSLSLGEPTTYSRKYAGVQTELAQLAGEVKKVLHGKRR